MIWPFKRNKKLKVERPPINEDWAPGDLAYCVDGNWGAVTGPPTASISRVEFAFPGVERDTGALGWGLKLQSWPDRYAATAFRKVRPDVTVCSTEFANFMKRLRKRPAPAGADQ
jgi:hypothetical protein